MRTVEYTPKSGIEQFITYWTSKFGDAWMWMLAAGIIHRLAPGVPAFGFWTVFLVTLLIGKNSNMYMPIQNGLNTKRTVKK